MIKIVEAKEKHLDAMYEIEGICFSSPWSYENLKEDVLTNRIALYWVALKEDEVIGYVGVWYFLDEAHITTIAVKPEYQNQHVGRKMLLKMFAYVEKKGVQNVTLEVRESNQVAIHLYEYLGFTYGGKRKKYYADTQEDAFILWKSLV